MLWWEYLVWGISGGVLVAGFELTQEIRVNGDWPWRQRMGLRAGPYIIMSALRIAVGGGLALGVGQSGQIDSPFAAILIGITTPLLISRLASVSPADPIAEAPPSRRASTALTERVLSELPESVARRVVDLMGAADVTDSHEAVPSSKVSAREISHSLGTPLLTIESSAALLDDRQADRRDRIIDAVRTCQSFLAGYKEVDAQGVFSQQHGGWDIEETLRSATRVYSGHTLYKGGVSVSVPGSFPGYTNSFILLIVLPLLENAIEHSVENAPISIAASDEGTHLGIAVTSTPTVLPENDRIYEERYSTKPGHSGLGLSTVRSLLVMQRGASLRHTIHQDSITFEVALPGRDTARGRIGR